MAFYEISWGTTYTIKSNEKVAIFKHRKLDCVKRRSLTLSLNILTSDTIDILCLVYS